MGVIDFSQINILIFLTLFLRISGIAAFFPIFGEEVTPVMVKIFFSLVLSMILYPLCKGYYAPVMQADLIFLFVLILQELTIGLLIGLIAKFVFQAVNVASEIISFQMGFGIVNVADPTSSERVSIVHQLQIFIAFMIFLAFNVHHVFFDALMSSFKLVAPTTLSFSSDFGKDLIAMSANVINIGFKLAAPVAIILLITNVGLGAISRAVPQMNVFMVSFPVTIGVGLIVMALTIPLFTAVVHNEYANLKEDIFKIMKLM